MIVTGRDIVSVALDSYLSDSLGFMSVRDAAEVINPDGVKIIGYAYDPGSWSTSVILDDPGQQVISLTKPGSAAPEPVSWAMMISGIRFVEAAVRRKGGDVARLRIGVLGIRRGDLGDPQQYYTFVEFRQGPRQTSIIVNRQLPSQSEQP